ncbi:hypothetical protein Dda_1142 [Drechslerella dactyloides]|uniref:Uncharacterized protein n=1 Tax=Drechslerella dactyloides TaxID=74499 RepID=A0AAD6J8L3_DREDA|nr:hypothetical protein Dda_1142 [Drechslerella dactyloides]
MSTEAVESAPASSPAELYSYYKSTDKKPLSTLPAADLEAISTAVTKALKSVAAQNCLPKLIEESEISVDTNDGWPISLEQPPAPSNGALAKYSKAITNYDPSTLLVDARILQEYEAAPADTPYKQHRLLEIVLAAIHDLAIDLYRAASPPPTDPLTNGFIPPPYPLIAHSQYYASKPWKKLYDFKAVGFWAEALIFGGVVHFDRKPYTPGANTDDEEAYTGIWLHGLPNAYTESLWRVPDDVVTKALTEGSLPFDISAAAADAVAEAEEGESDGLLGLQEAQEEHLIYRDPFLANQEAYTGEHGDEVVGVSDEDLAEIRALHAEREAAGISGGLKLVDSKEFGVVAKSHFLYHPQHQPKSLPTTITTTNTIAMLSTTKLNQRKLLHLHAASHALFPSSPAVAAHIASNLASVAAASDIQLADATWRKICACCGYTLVPGWTASVRARGSLGDTYVPSTASDSNSNPPATAHEKPQTQTQAGEQSVVTRRRARRRGKRTRGAHHDKTETCTTAVESATTPPDVTSRPARRTDRPRRRITPKQPRIISTCKICARKTIHPLPQPPVDPTPSHPSTTTQEPVTSSTTTTDAAAQPASSNATAKKRAKSRKNTLAEMLAKEHANRAAAGGNSGGSFGLGLMDFMRTS